MSADQPKKDRQNKHRSFQPGKLPLPKQLQYVEPLDPSQFNVLEIGPGVGTHPIRYAKAHPQHQVYGVEHSKERFGKFAKRIEQHQELEQDLVNLTAVHTDGEAFVVHRVPENSLDRVFFLYPNPYPKAAQANKRWHNMPFMEYLIARMKPGARLLLATNEFFYADEAEETLPSLGLELLNREAISLKTHPEFRWRTHFEKKYLHRGELLHELVWMKR